MQLYDASSKDFVRQALGGELADTLERRFEDYFGHRPSESEVRSWQKSLAALAECLRTGDLEHAWVFLEFQLPLSSARADCTIRGLTPA